VGAAGSRRETLNALAGAIVAPLLIGVRGEEAQAGIPIVHGKPPGKSCEKPAKCCSGRCQNHHCACAKKGKLFLNRVDVNCCSRQCREGTCR
jgi:hypothetical protein